MEYSPETETRRLSRPRLRSLMTSVLKPWRPKKGSHARNKMGHLGPCCSVNTAGSKMSGLAPNAKCANFFLPPQPCPGCLVSLVSLSGLAQVGPKNVLACRDPFAGSVPPLPRHHRLRNNAGHAPEMRPHFGGRQATPKIGATPSLCIVFILFRQKRSQKRGRPATPKPRPQNVPRTAPQA